MWEPRPAYSEDLGMILDELKEEHGLALFVSTACLAFSNDTKNHNGLGRILSNKIPATIGMQLPILEGHGEVFIFTNELYYQAGLPMFWKHLLLPAMSCYSNFQNHQRGLLRFFIKAAMN